MSASCCDQPTDAHRGNEGYRRVLWAVLAINAAMFAVEVAAGLAAGSASLQADALDFLGDAGNYAISLFVVGMALRYRALAALLKGATMGAVRSVGARRHRLAYLARHCCPKPSPWARWALPRCSPMRRLFGLLWAYRGGDSNMRSAWICTRNDVLGNLAVLLAALGVLGTGTGWPDVAVAAIMAGLALQGAWVVLNQSWSELRISHFAPAG